MGWVPPLEVEGGWPGQLLLLYCRHLTALFCHMLSDPPTNPLAPRHASSGLSRLICAPFLPLPTLWNHQPLTTWRCRDSRQERVPGQEKGQGCHTRGWVPARASTAYLIPGRGLGSPVQGCSNHCQLLLCPQRPGNSGLDCQ